MFANTFELLVAGSAEELVVTDEDTPESPTADSGRPAKTATARGQSLQPSPKAPREQMENPDSPCVAAPGHLKLNSKGGNRTPFKGSPYKEQRNDMPANSTWAAFTDLEEALNFADGFLRSKRQHVLEDWSFEMLGQLELSEGVSCLKQVCAQGIQNPSALLRWKVRDLLENRDHTRPPMVSTPAPARQSTPSVASSGGDAPPSKKPKATTKTTREKELAFDWKPAEAGVKAQLPSAASFCPGCGCAAKWSTSALKSDDGAVQTIVRTLTDTCGTTSTLTATQTPLSTRCMMLHTSCLMVDGLLEPSEAPREEAALLGSGNRGSQDQRILDERTVGSNKVLGSTTAASRTFFCANCGEDFGQPLSKDRVGDLNMGYHAWTCSSCKQVLAGIVYRSQHHTILNAQVLAQ